MDTLIASKYANPLQDGQTNEAITMSKDNNGTATVICGAGPTGATESDAVIERRHSASASSNLTTEWCNGGANSRRHSLPSANGNADCAAEHFSSLPANATNGAAPAAEDSEKGTPNGNGFAVAIDMNGGGHETHDEDEDFDDEDLSETAALTQKSRKLKELI